MAATVVSDSKAKPVIPSSYTIQDPIPKGVSPGNTRWMCFDRLSTNGKAQEIQWPFRSS